MKLPSLRSAPITLLNHIVARRAGLAVARGANVAYLGKQRMCITSKGLLCTGLEGWYAGISSHSLGMSACRYQIYLDGQLVATMAPGSYTGDQMICTAIKNG